MGIAHANEQIHYSKKWLSLRANYGLKDDDLGARNRSEDARGRWYIRATPKQQPMQQLSLFNDAVGIDLSLKDFAATSNGTIAECLELLSQVRINTCNGPMRE